CDGQVLVTHDLLGLFDRFTPKFVKQYANLHSVIAQALAAYRDEVEAGQFPAPEHTVNMPDETWEALLAEVGE
ncbi:MAG TPA: 3-methyl-2-oxobutanoate hydroxymethyltransferase, partial [Chloroflexi bacterium]|nr:3-methyl-2-oxobutanoate hydroxymethyltransferase [Chloroflexota bacterium]